MAQPLLDHGILGNTLSGLHIKDGIEGEELVFTSELFPDFDWATSLNFNELMQ